jgi:hypothetical protein
MSTTAVKPAPCPPAREQEMKVFFKPRFGIRVVAGGLSVDVRTGPDEDKEKSEPSHG